MTARDTYDLSIVFVHGIGENEPGVTLEHMGRDFADAVTRLDPEATVAELDDGIVVETVGQRWKIGEANWDVSFTEPGFVETVRWLVLVAPWILQREALFWSRRRKLGEGGVGSMAADVWRNWTSARFWARLGGAMFLAPILQVLALVAALLIFVPGVGRVVRLVLVGVLGDAYKFVSYPEDTDRMTDAVEARLDEACHEATAVMAVAHSQGSAVVLDAIRRKQPPGLRRLVTLGPGIGKLYGLRELADRTLFLSAWTLFRIGALVAFVASISGQTQGQFRGTIGLIALAIGGFAPLFGAQTGRRRATEAIASAPGLGSEWTWLDLWSTWDLVPDGALRTPTAAVGTGVISVEVRNNKRIYSSLRADHTTYLQNEAQVTPILYYAAVEAAAVELPHPYTPMVALGRTTPKPNLALGRRSDAENLEMMIATGVETANPSLPALLTSLSAVANEQFPVQAPRLETRRQGLAASPKLVFGVLGGIFVILTLTLAPPLIRAASADSSELVFYAGTDMARTAALAGVVRSGLAGVWLLVAVIGVTAILYYRPIHGLPASVAAFAGTAVVLAAITWGMAFSLNTIVSQQEIAVGECLVPAFDENQFGLQSVEIGADAIRLPCDEPHTAQLVHSFEVAGAVHDDEAAGIECEVGFSARATFQAVQMWQTYEADFFVIWPTVESFEEDPNVDCYWITTRSTTVSAIAE